jgi:hypothetical protein
MLSGHTDLAPAIRTWRRRPFYKSSFQLADHPETVYPHEHFVVPASRMLHPSTDRFKNE